MGGLLVSAGILAVGVESTVTQLSATTSLVQPLAGAAPSSGGTGTEGTSGTAGAAPSSSPSSSDTSGSSPAATTGLTDGTYTGTAVSTRYGTVQVQVTISGGTFGDVTALHLTDDDGRSVQISARAAPVLAQEAVAAQSASIDTVSGATYTSDGYLQSLQSALDQAR
ncbi:FMN-binding protein (plasmid) [Frigoribacterium sp. NBH87]|nr:FMN-binding protein [Frigoribacterium sp. NBH87]QNE45469.1 FMN-binding protein [Frigoribacterium sp. NBH87]